jgi:uridine kinase
VKSIFVGVVGGSGSGKSTLTRALWAKYPSAIAVVQHDAYYRPLSEEERSRAAVHYFDHPDELETDRLCRDLDALARGNAVRVPRYDFATHTRFPEAGWREVAPARFILVEGILVLADESLRRRLDKAVFIEADESERVRRRLARDAASRGRKEDSVRAQLERTVLPMHRKFVDPSRSHATLVIDGTAPVALGVTLLEGLLGLGRAPPQVGE